MRSYEAARGLFNFLAFCSWAIIGIGGVVAMIAVTAVSSGFGGSPSAIQLFLAALPGAGIALGGLYGLAIVQMARAGVDSAEYGQQALGVARQQLEVSREALTQSKQYATSYTELRPQPETEKTLHTSDEQAGYAAHNRAETAEPSSQAPAAISLENGAVPETKVVTEDPTAVQVEYRKGMWHVGSRTFQAETPARNYASQLGVNKNAKLT